MPSPKYGLERLVISVSRQQRLWLQREARKRQISIALVVRELVEAARFDDDGRQK
jgi:hypothetical protein